MYIYIYIYIYTCTRLIDKPITTKENEVEKERRSNPSDSYRYS